MTDVHEGGATQRYAIDPAFADLVAMIPEGSVEDVVGARRMMEEILPIINADIDLSGLVIEDRVVPGPADHPDLAVRTYTPETGATGAAALYIHGGGFTVGSLDSEHGRAALIAREVGAVVVSVDYRLAPEHPFPAGIEDCYAALEWMQSSTGELSIEAGRIGVVGSSAGGGLAAGLALLARDRSGPALCFQFLGVPEIDDRLITGSMQRFVDTPMWNRPSAEGSWRMYLGPEVADGAGEVSPYAAPARAADLSGLPPAYVSAMEFDPLRDEGIAYALALLSAGVSCELHTFPGTFHGSSIVTTAEVSRREVDEQLAVLRRRL